MRNATRSLLRPGRIPIRLPRDARGLMRWLIVATVVVTAVTVAVVVIVGPAMRTATARFSSAVGLYPGSSVRILGVQVGKIDSVTPHEGGVDVRFSYEARYQIPADVYAVLISPALVPDRFIQLAPAYQSGPVLADGAQISTDHTAVPMEIDQITAAVNELAVALGPKGVAAGAGSGKSPVSRVIDAAAANLDGNGAALGASINNLSQAATTLAAASPDLYSTIKNLQTFVTALNRNDQQVRSANSLLAAVTGNLADERSVLGAALVNLNQALTTVSNFLATNKATISSSITSLTAITSTLLANKNALAEILTSAPAAVTNVVNAFDPATSSLRSRLQLGTLTTSGADVCYALIHNHLLTMANAAMRAYCQSSQVLAAQSAASTSIPGAAPAALPTVPGAS